MEKTLVIFKPDSVMRGIVGSVLNRFEQAGFKIVAMKMIKPDTKQLDKHYEGIGKLKTRKGDEIFESQLSSMQDGPVILMVLEGIEAVSSVRKMVGETEPKTAQPGTIRGDFAHANYSSAASIGKGVANIVHASATKEEAELEIAHWFDNSEIYRYKSVHEQFTLPSN